MDPIIQAALITDICAGFRDLFLQSPPDEIEPAMQRIRDYINDIANIASPYKLDKAVVHHALNALCKGQK
jgi:hypothetical protein